MNGMSFSTIWCNTEWNLFFSVNLPFFQSKSISSAIAYVLELINYLDDHYVIPEASLNESESKIQKINK